MKIACSLQPISIPICFAESAETGDHCSKHHPSNWLDEEDEDEEDEDDGGAFIPSTPPF